ncbi:MAG: hypothetical protein KC438_01450 [Thermomicrobiales bacterium]|nr:hypothetical protein [Thermomicrobiales bacterium]MCO5222154.1 hypothetical protein [Thermomicrobiales bacterium]
MLSISRRNLLIGSALTALSPRISAADTPVASPSPVADRRLDHCGLYYDLGAELMRGELTRPAEHETYFRDELTAIRDQLHSPSVALYGSVPDQLVAGLEIAADLGFDIRLQTRLNYQPEAEMVDRLAFVAENAERARQQGVPIVVDVGCEYLVFSGDLVEGESAAEKLEVLLSEDADYTELLGNLAAMLGNLATTARSTFGGQVTYSDTPMDPSIWEPFDIIGIDHYLSSDTASTYVETIDNLAGSGKPVWVNEFGCATWDGAAELGGMAWDVVDYETDPPQIQDGIVRDEAEQAQAILDTLSLIEQSQAERAYLNEFIAPGSPRSDDPRYDFDLLSYGIVAAWGPDGDQPYDTTGYWEPKVAFDELAAWNAER